MLYCQSKRRDVEMMSARWPVAKVNRERVRSRHGGGEEYFITTYSFETANVEMLARDDILG